MVELKIGLMTISFLILLAYHLHLVHQVRKSPLKTSFGLTSRLREAWVKAVMQEKMDILAVQTLRNWVMTATFLASTAILITLGMVGAALSTEKAEELSQALNLLGGPSETSWRIKLMVLILDFFVTFFNFLLAIRYFNHVNFMLTIPAAYHPLATPDFVTKILNRAQVHNTVGLHGYYLAIPFTLWLFGSVWMLAGSLALVAVLYKLDRTP
jgi:uncharacterized membrane protein